MYKITFCMSVSQPVGQKAKQKVFVLCRNVGKTFDFCTVSDMLAGQMFLC